MNSTVKILKIFVFVRIDLPKAAMVIGWQIANKVGSAPNDNRGLHLKGDGAIVLAVSPEGWKDSGKSKLISFYKTDDEGFAAICTIEFKLKVSFFTVMTVRV